MVEVSSIPKKGELSEAGTIMHSLSTSMLIPINHEYTTLYDKRELRQQINPSFLMR